LPNLVPSAFSDQQTMEPEGVPADDRQDSNRFPKPRRSYVPQIPAY
jgi:hypothetical protein